MIRIAVVGASGFVGSTVVNAAQREGHDVISLRAPRLNVGANLDGVAASFVTILDGVDAVVNCAGNPDASATNLEELRAVNSVLPGVIGVAARLADVPRFIHVSSAVVQGRRPVLDSSEDTDGFSPYARSKIAGEAAASAGGPRGTTAYRPPSVHASTRRVTRQLTAIARSPLSTVVAPGDRPTPQTHIRDVGDALLLLCTSKVPPPPIVHHPWQGHTTAKLLQLLGNGRTPRRISPITGRIVLTGASVAGTLTPRVAPYARRLEMVWLGQAQARSWLDEQGWKPVTTDEDWVLMGNRATDA